MAAADQGQPPSSGAATSLAGFAVAVASERRRHHLAGRLELLGARVASVQAVQTMAQPDADAVRVATLACLDEPVDDVVVASVFGLRSWLAIARRLGYLDEVIGRLRVARLLARDARVADELRDLGLTEIWSTASLTTEDLFHYLLAQPQAGRRVLAQLDTDSERELCHALRAAGATVIEVATTIARPPRTVDVLRRLSDL
ncbi:MAG TPA: uroporphyrinogen-III synthase, partial [Micromonosporaceae bacterium]